MVKGTLTLEVTVRSTGEGVWVDRYGFICPRMKQEIIPIGWATRFLCKFRTTKPPGLGVF